MHLRCKKLFISFEHRNRRISWLMNMSLKQLVEELKKNPGVAKQSMKIKIVKSGPYQVNVKAGKHKFILDEDKAIGGSAEGPSPAQMLLASIGGCMLNTLSAWSQLLDTPITAAEINVKGTLDVQGMLGLDANISPGFQEISIDINIDSDAPPEKKQKLIETVEKYCPVYNTLRNPAKIIVNLK
jgi:uncharacterized OsmC-like protein